MKCSKNVFISKSYHNISQFPDGKKLILLSSKNKASLSSSLDVHIKSWRKNDLKCWEQTKSSYVLTNLERGTIKQKKYREFFPIKQLSAHFIHKIQSYWMCDLMWQWELI